ncbi:UDP-2,4-diacetamido-2,4,6-trideoxy-beta-L-altropyranose hydrolase [Tsuneonella dongtanensis]|uniref:UDP-2,4-diacetamido-2,4, 6-trideoxy-beta-L-altropyranose hydrolase n=1 Tax=Tsuneonella dongtanensis TaxID=692370 RepID=A0A1B2A9Z3_9SPHN|nr:UDP-2,4-diacetamido-2,4,6-trideoxy-beta-L-altropyranose hydrolase [Tsuneonella dongtanensis]ANY18952.1 UDP-2,4-diacetamido-2,4,6-trideoxy-beta-L-altropyranose hydrolase [Tsuneonella dongtanensis]
MRCNEPPRIAIRADAGPSIGIGHLRRCLSLAQALRDLGVQVRFVTRVDGYPSAEVIEGAGFAVSCLPADGDDAAETIAVLSEWRPDWIIVDSYRLDAEWHSTMRDRLGCRVAAIDDVADREFDVEVLIDHNLAPDARAKYAGLLLRGSRILAGPRFALLGRVYADARPVEIVEKVRSIGIFVGGFDQSGLAKRALGAVRDAGFCGRVEVVAASADPRLPALEEAIAADENATLSLDLPNLADFFARHDLQIGAGGGATWERCCLGVPSVLAVVAENQLAVVPHLEAAGVILASAPDRESLAAAVARLIGDVSLRQEMARAARSLVDGAGSDRVAVALLADRLRVREATEEDCELAYRWRNDSATRAVSRERSEIPLDDHRDWFARTLADPARSLLIGMIGSRPVGVIRFDRVDEASVEVSLYLDPDLHGIGIGPHLLAAGERRAAAGLDIVAEVLEGNRGSARLFESSGYFRVSPGHYRKPGVLPAGDD